MKSAIALCGLPGAGKSKAAEQFAQMFNSGVVSMGDAIRRQYRDETGSDPNSEELAEFAAMWRENAPAEIPETVCEIAQGIVGDPVVIDGVRSTTDYEVLSEQFAEFYLVQIKASFYTRLDRLTGRGREGEDEFDAVDLAERDMNEHNNLGFLKLKDGFPDTVIYNDGSLSLLRSTLTNVAERSPFERQSPTQVHEQ